MLQQGLGTIDSQVNTQADALRGNPKAMGQVQQEQKASLGKGIQPNLMRALALQKVASETAAAENQLKLSMQQNPATIVEQLEQNAVARTQDDLLKQTAGIMGERNKKREKQISAAKPPQQQGQRPPMQMAQGAPQGAPQGLPAAPRPPTQFAAQGGIIGYQGGGQIDKIQIDRIKAFIAQRGGKLSQQDMADIVNASKNNPEVIAFLTQNQGYKSSTDMMDMDKAAGLAAPAGAPVANASIAAATAKGLSKDKPNTGIATVPAGGLGVPPSDKEVDKPDTGIATAPAVPAGGLGVPSAAVPAGATTDPLKGALGAAGIKPTQISPEGLTGKFGTNASKTQVTDAVGEKTTGIMQAMRDKDPQASRISEETRQDVRYNRDAKRIAEEELIAEKKALDDKQLDSKSVARERVNAGLAGLIQGGTSRGASIARSKFDANVSKRQRDAINETIKLTRDKDKSDDDRLKAIDVQAAKTFEQASAEKLASIKGLIGLEGANIAKYNSEALRDLEANKLGINTRLTALATETRAELNRMIQESADVTQYAALHEKVMKTKTAALELYYGPMEMEIKAAKLAQLGGDGVTDVQQALLDEYDTKFAAILEAKGIDTMLEQIKNEALKSGGVSSVTGTANSNTNTALTSAMNKNLKP
jgi:hypothetical protein